MEKKRWIDEFSKKYGVDTIVRLDAKGLAIRDLMDEVGVMPFIVEKRLVVVDGIPKSTKEEIHALEAAIHPASIVLMVDPAPDKRLGGVKRLFETAVVKTFAPVRGAALLSWLHEEASRLGASFDRAALLAMVERLGDDQESLVTELKKISLAVQGRVVTREDVDIHTIPSDEGIVWTMTDLIAAGKRAEALAYTRRMLDRGSDAYGLWAILLSMLKNAVAVRAALDDGLSGRDVAERTGVHPFALRSLQPYSARHSIAVFTRAVSWAVEADEGLKTGRHRATDDAPQELHTLIERLLFEFPANA